MSDRLDIVRLIDARVTFSRRTVTRSKQIAEAARGELHIHEGWLRQHHERSEADLKRHQRRIKRRERSENNKRFAIAALLFLPRLGVRIYRSVVSGLRTADSLFLSGCAWLGKTAYGIGGSLISLIGGAVTLVGAKALRLGLMLAAALWLALSLLGKGAYALGLRLIGASVRGLSWLGPRASSFGRWLIAYLSLRLTQLATAIGGVGVRVGGDAKRQASHLKTRLRPRARALKRKQAAGLDPSRLQQAAFIRLRAEHDRLQARIHAMDRHYEQRLAHRDRDAREWVELRKLAQNARRLFEVQERQALGRAAPRGGHSASCAARGRASRKH
ncbi:MAG TPA: hypothetical protein VFQ31_01890 [Methyloceanibacter sp.]|nr:hypothetical protein [Methyloceanibacter sp.]